MTIEIEWVHTYVYVYIYLFVYVCIHTDIYVCMYIYIPKCQYCPTEAMADEIEWLRYICTYIDMSFEKKN